MGYLRRVGVAAGAVALLLVCTAAPAMAGGDEVKVSPYRAEPGDSLEVEAYGCGEADTAFAESDAFDMDVKLTEESEGYWVSDQADVDYDADPGRYEVTVTCKGDDALNGSFLVVDGWGPDTGGGGLALADESSPAPVGWAIGGVAVAGALATALVVLRRRVRMRG